MRHLRIYRAIDLIQRHGSIRKAAELLSVSPSALNRSVQTFEDELEVPVFDRVPGGVKLSTAGELLLDIMQRHLVEFDDLKGQLGQLRDGLAGTLRLSLGTDLGAGLLPDVLAEFANRYPGVSVEVMADDGPAALMRREVDVALLTNPVTDDHVEVLFSASVPLAAWTRSPPAGRSAPDGLWDLADHRLIVPPLATGTRTALGHLFRKQRLTEPPCTAQPATFLAQGAPIGPEIWIYPAICFTGRTAPELLPMRLGQVQVIALRRTQGVLTRSAQAFLTMVQGRLDAVSEAGA